MNGARKWQTWSWKPDQASYGKYVPRSKRGKKPREYVKSNIKQVSLYDYVKPKLDLVNVTDNVKCNNKE